VTLPSTVQEGAGKLVQAGTFTVTPRAAMDVAVSLYSSDTGKVQVAASVIVPAGVKTAAFDLIVLDDHKIDGTRPVTITAHVNNWIDGQATLNVLDNESPTLSLFLPARASEGNGALSNAGLVRLPGTLETNLVVFLASSNIAKVLAPASVVILA